MMKSSAWFEELQKNVSSRVTRSILLKAWSRAQIRIDALEQQLHALEVRVASLESPEKLN